MNTRHVKVIRELKPVHPTHLPMFAGQWIARASAQLWNPLCVKCATVKLQKTHQVISVLLTNACVLLVELGVMNLIRKGWTPKTKHRSPKRKNTDLQNNYNNFTVLPDMEVWTA